MGIELVLGIAGWLPWTHIFLLFLLDDVYLPGYLLIQLLQLPIALLLPCGLLALKVLLSIIFEDV